MPPEKDSYKKAYNLSLCTYAEKLFHKSMEYAIHAWYNWVDNPSSKNYSFYLKECQISADYYETMIKIRNQFRKKFPDLP